MLDRPCRNSASAVVALFLVLGSVSTGRAQNDDETRARAKAAFEHGVAEYAAAHYEQALASFQEAYRIRPHPLVNVNIANCYDKLGQPLPAVALFEHFLESDAGTMAQRQEVNSALERLKKQVGKILLRVSPDGAGVIIDQGEQRSAPILDAIPLEAGNHNLTVTSEGYRTVQRPLIVKGGTTLELTVTLEREGAPTLALVPSPEPPPVGDLPAPSETAPAAAVPASHAIEPAAQDSAEREPAARSNLPVAAFITGGAALVLAATATITGVLALGANKDFTQYKDARFDPAATAMQHVTAYDKASDAANRARALAIVTDVTLVGAAVCAVVSVVLFTTHHAGKSEQASPSARLSPLLLAHGAGVALQTKVGLLE